MRIGFLAAALAAAAALPAALAAGDAGRGETAAQHLCVNCHGLDGRSAIAGVPSLAGQRPEFLTLVLILLREQIRVTPPMNAFAQGLSDQQIEDLSAWFASLPPGPPDDRAPRDAALAERGRELASRMNCGVCHRPDYSGQNQVPRLAGQREDMLVHAMKSYRAGTRQGSDSSMNAAVRGASDADIQALAHYLAQLP